MLFRSDIGLNVEYSGTQMAGYQIGAISTTPETISVVGSDEALNALKQEGNTITIPADYIDISGASSDVTQKIDLSELMPENMRIAANTTSTVDVVIPIIPSDSREIVIDVDNITTKSLGSDLTVSYDQTEVSVLIRGLDEVISSVKTSDLNPYINCAGLEEGDYMLKLYLTVPENVEIVDEVSIPVHIKQAAKAG